jgi:DNA-binding NtrC family response regulator
VEQILIGVSLVKQLIGNNKMTELKPKIMVVDDEPIIGEILTKFLTTKDYEVASFTSGKKALEHLKTNEVNLLLTDLDMPDISGIELIKATKELKPKLPILVMTGMYGSGLMDELFKLGISDYIAKPFELDSLEEIIESRL